VTVTPTSLPVPLETKLTDTGANDTSLYNTGQITSLKDATWNRKQFYSVTKQENGSSKILARDLACPPCNVGKNSIPNYATLTNQAIHAIGSTKVFAGQRADGFYVDLDRSLTSATCALPTRLPLEGAAVAGSTPWPRRTCTPSPFRYRSRS